MNAAFTDSAQYYDLIYSKKNYSQEVSLLDQIIKRNLIVNNPKLLDVGCGTGKHIVWFHRKKYICTGIDLSENMLAVAENRLGPLKPKPDLRRSDVRFLKINKKFDVVCSLFHVTSYLLTNRDINRAFSNIRNHLNKDGLFLFDFWHKPGVLYQKPQMTFQHYQKESINLYRIKSPRIRAGNKIVDIHHTLFTSNNNRYYVKFEETHSMRCFELVEIQNLLTKTGFRIVENGILNNNIKALDVRSWDAFVVAKAI